MPSLRWQELPKIMEAFSTATPRLQNFFLFTLCSMLRPGEAAKIEKQWIRDNVITIPASQMKKRREHRVPLTAFMLHLLEQEKRYSPHPRNKYLFSGRNSKTHISKQTLAKFLHKTKLKNLQVPHGFRVFSQVLDG